MSYELDYTYLTELEVDTRQTFSDISDDLMLVHDTTISSGKFDMKTEISCWQDFFWKYQDDGEDKFKTKRQLDITFTDISVIHNDYDSLDKREMLTIGDLNSFFSKLNTERSWFEKWSFNEMTTKITSSLNSFHETMLSLNHIYPLGSMVVSKNKPMDFGTNRDWIKKSGYYLGEAGISEISVGQNKGTSKTLADLNIVAPDLDDIPVPPHEHTVKFIPESGGNSGNTSTTTTAQAVNFKDNTLEDGGGSNQVGGSDKSPPNGAIVFAITEDANGSSSTEGEKEPSFSVGTKEVKPTITKINVAPQVYPLNATVWQREATT